MKRYIYIIGFLILFSTGAFAQGMFSISYDIGVPVGGTTDLSAQQVSGDLALKAGVLLPITCPMADHSTGLYSMKNWVLMNGMLKVNHEQHMVNNFAISTLSH